MMLRVLIADDEYLARSNLRGTLEKLSVPIKLVGEATTGAELVQMVEQQMPDVAFVDIRMPGMNGLEAIRIGKKLSPATYWFILTGFSEFEYAKEAVRLGAADYLLKPADPTELENLLRNVSETVQRQLTRLNQQFERDVMALSHGLSSLRQEDDAYLLKANFIGVVIYVDSWLPEAVVAEREVELGRNIDVLLEDYVALNLRAARFTLPNGHMVLVLAWMDTARETGKRQAEKILRRLEETIRAREGNDFQITLFQTDTCRSIDSLDSQLKRLQEMSAARAVLGIGKKWTVRDFDSTLLNDEMLNVAALLEALHEAFREADTLEYRQLLPRLERAIKALPLRDAPTSKDTLAGFLNCAFGIHLCPVDSIRAWIECLEAQGEHMLVQSRATDQPELIDRVLGFIATHYPSDIGVGQIAEQLGITPNYLSATFKKKMGMSFVTYLTQVRMLKAKELLSDPARQIQKVAEAVGYYNTRYFAKLFIQFAGCTPSEYRKMIAGH